MLYSKIIGFCFQIHTKHKYTVDRTYRAVNTLILGYKNQSLIDVQWNNLWLFSDPHTKQSFGRTYRAVNIFRLGYKGRHTWTVKYSLVDLMSTHNT
jgi:hypothetical protein